MKTKTIIKIEFPANEAEALYSLISWANSAGYTHFVRQTGEGFDSRQMARRVALATGHEFTFGSAKK